MKRGDPRGSLVASACAVVGACALVVAQGPNGVDVTSVVKVFVARDTPGMLVAYRYEFRGRPTVYIKGLGTVPGRGEFEYLTREPVLEVRDAPGGAMLASVPLKETVIVAAKAPTDYVPSEKTFPAAFRSDTWPAATPMQGQVNTVLGKYFMYLPHDDNKVTYTVTTFMPLKVENLPRGITAQIAVVISFPHDQATDGYTFRVRSLVHERRALSDETRPTSNQMIQGAANRFIDDLIKEIKAGAPGRP